MQSRLPKQAKVVKYGPDGSSVASVGVAMYGAPTDEGAHTIRFTSQTEKAQLLSHTELAVNKAGLPTSATTVLHNPHDASVRQRLEADYSGLEWTKSMRPRSGSVKIKAANDQKIKIHHAEVSFKNEQMHTVTIAHSSPKDGETIRRYTDLDFSAAKMLGQLLIGGHINIIHRGADKSVYAQSKLTLTEEGLASVLEVTKLKKDGVSPSVLSKWDYSKVTFNARRKIEDGILVTTTTNPEGKLRATTTITFSGGQAIEMKVKTADGKIIDCPLKRATPEKVGDLLSPVTEFVAIKTTPHRDEQHSVESVKRPDGTIERSTELWYTTKIENGKESKIPLRAVIQDFAPNGTTVMKRKEIDFSSTDFGDKGNTVSGSVQVASFANDKMVQRTTVVYSK